MRATNLSPSDRLPVLARIYWPGWLDSAWVVVSLLNLVAVLVFGHWETMPFHLIWISLTVIYGFRVWSAYPTLWVLVALMVAISAATVLDVWPGTERLSGLTEVPLMTVMFVTVGWHARREAAANRRWQQISEENGRLLANQRRFLQDAAHQLRTPITIALGHAELLARELPGAQQGQDIGVVLGELTRLRRLSERLLMIAASEAPDFLRAEPVDLDRFTMEAIRRWRPAAPRRWRLGRLDQVTVRADRERLGEAVDALLDNAVRHTGPDDVIKLSVMRGPGGSGGSGGSGGPGGGPARLIIADGGSGIPAGQLASIFERFRTVGDDASRGTGLGLALVRAVARAHGGEVTVCSEPGRGTEFQLLLPVAGGDRPGAERLAGPGTAEPRGPAPAGPDDEAGRGLGGTVPACPAGSEEADLGEPAGRLA